jgi:hypothetical protein
MRRMRANNFEALRRLTTCDEQADFLAQHARRTDEGGYEIVASDWYWTVAVDTWGNPEKPRTVAANPFETTYLALSAFPLSRLRETLAATVEVLGREKVETWAKEMLAKDCKCLTKKAYARETLKLLKDHQ